MTDRYIKNAETVRKIAKIFGLRLLSFDPNWTFIESDDNQPRFALEIVSQSMLSNYSIPDDFMGKVALLMNLTWEFDLTDEELKSSIDGYEKDIRDIGKYRISIPGSIRDDPICKDALENIDSLIEKMDKQSRDEIQSRLDRVKSILNIRDGLKNYSSESV